MLLGVKQTGVELAAEEGGAEDRSLEGMGVRRQGHRWHWVAREPGLQSCLLLSG